MTDLEDIKTAYREAVGSAVVMLREHFDWLIEEIEELREDMENVLNQNHKFALERTEAWQAFEAIELEREKLLTVVDTTRRLSKINFL